MNRTIQCSIKLIENQYDGSRSPLLGIQFLHHILTMEIHSYKDVTSKQCFNIKKRFKNKIKRQRAHRKAILSEELEKYQNRLKKIP